jgi:putative nucleotidyltransferase with HDIG domain
MAMVPRTLVPSGDFTISRAKPGVLHAGLGTCVGVAIVDRQARVGGLYHILLPDGVSPEAGLGELLCATTGMPAFLEALRQAGARPEQMEATLAGGALIGGSSQLDVVLDIGGRTVDVVNQQLATAGIPVVRSETGGHFGSTLSLDLETLACDIAPVVSARGAGGTVPTRLSPAELDRICTSVRPIPQAALKIIRTIQSDDYSLAEVAREIRRDQVLTARVISACNSAYLGARERITSIDHAVLLLGGRQVAQMILSSVMGRFFDGAQGGYSMSRGGLYHHAISTAIVSEQIAKLTRAATLDLAYTAGLLHDIGKVVLDQYVASALPLFYREVVGNGVTLLAAERQLLGVSHEEAGARLAELWSFPPELRSVIGHHTCPDPSGAHGRLTAVVYLANLLVSWFDAGHDLDRIGSDSLAGALDQLSIRREELPTLIGRIPWRVLDAPGYF